MQYSKFNEQEVRAKLRIVERLKGQQNFKAAVIGGLIGVLSTAVVWAWFSVSSGFQFGFMAIFLGLVVGLNIQMFGKGVDRKFAYLALGYALLGCLIGNFFIGLSLASAHYAMDPVSVLISLDVGSVFSLLLFVSDIKDLLFYMLAMGSAYGLARIKLSKQEKLALFQSELGILQAKS